MNHLRHPLRSPAAAAGPSVLTVLVSLMIGAHLLRVMFALPTPVPPGALSMVSLQNGEWWSVFTWMFTHDDIIHVGTNVLLLVMAGRAVERQAGARHMLYIFLFSAWAGAALNMLLRPEVRAIIGASGGVFGVIGAFSALFPEYDIMRPLRGIVPGRLRAKRLFPAFLIVHVGMELVRLLFLKNSGPDELHKAAHLVHAGGLITGWLYGRYLAADESLAVDDWNDFFPQGMRRRFRDIDGGQPVPAGLPPRRIVDEEQDEAAVSAAPPPDLTDSEFLKERVDPVLEKLYEVGADKLSEEERAVLEEAARRFSKGRGASGMNG